MQQEQAQQLQLRRQHQLQLQQQQQQQPPLGLLAASIARTLSPARQQQQGLCDTDAYGTDGGPHGYHQPPDTSELVSARKQALERLKCLRAFQVY